MRYKWKTGQWAFVMHRVTGLALSVYLILHIYVVSSLYQPENFNKVMEFLNQPLFKLLEIGLLGSVIYHALNGLRIGIIDFADGTAKHALIFWVLMALGAVIFIAGALPFLHHGGVI